MAAPLVSSIKGVCKGKPPTGLLYMVQDLRFKNLKWLSKLEGNICKRWEKKWWLFRRGAESSVFKRKLLLKDAARKASNQTWNSALPTLSTSPKSPCKSDYGVPSKDFPIQLQRTCRNIISNNTSRNRPTADESARRFPWCLDCPGYGASGALMLPLFGKVGT